MTGLTLEPLTGSSPLGFLTALGALDVAYRTTPERVPALRWTDELVPRAVLHGVGSMDELIDAVVADAVGWRQSAVLRLPTTDLKPPPADLHRWAGAMAEQCRAESDLFVGLLAEGARAGNGASKPTHLHFTAGQQQFLSMVRTVADGVDRDAAEEALRGPWRYATTLPTLGWDTRGERVYALRGFDPAKEKRTGVLGADWLAFLGLTFVPTFAQDGKLVTTGCDPDWKSGSFVWPLWDVPLAPMTVRSLMSFHGLRNEPEQRRRLRGVFQVWEAPITRSDQGGYGSFRPPQPASRSRPRRAPATTTSTRRR